MSATTDLPAAAVTARAAAAEPSPPFATLDWLLLAGVASIWGSSFLFISVALDAGIAPGAITWLRVLLGGGALALVPRARAAVPWADRRRMFGLGTLWIAVPFTLFPLAQQHVDSAVAGMINGAVPLSTALFASVLTRTLPNRGVSGGLALGFLGVVSIALPRVTDGGGAALGIVLLVAAVALYGLSLNLAVPLQKQYGSEATMCNALAASAVLTAPFGLWGMTHSTFTVGGVAALVPLGVLGTGLAMVLFTTLVSRVGPPQGSIAIYFTPIVATILGVVVLGDTVGPPALVGTALVLAGAWVTSRSR